MLLDRGRLADRFRARNNSAAQLAEILIDMLMELLLSSSDGKSSIDCLSVASLGRHCQAFGACGHRERIVTTALCSTVFFHLLRASPDQSLLDGLIMIGDVASQHWLPCCEVPIVRPQSYGSPVAYQH